MGLAARRDSGGCADVFQADFTLWAPTQQEASSQEGRRGERDDSGRWLSLRLRSTSHKAKLTDFWHEPFSVPTAWIENG
jgi:hypothetical protein